MESEAKKRKMCFMDKMIRLRRLVSDEEKAYVLCRHVHKDVRPGGSREARGCESLQICKFALACAVQEVSCSMNGKPESDSKKYCTS